MGSPKAPYQGKVVKNQTHEHTITKPNSDAPSDANWETAHVTFDHGGNVPYLEGKSIGIIAPGPDKKGETPAKIRLYSIGSSAVGDFEDSKTVSLCVKRVVEVEEEKWPLKHSNRDVGEDKPDKAGTHFPNAKVYRGVCSNHICDMNVGDDVLITGPTGAEMLLPEDPNANIIMLATGTGIAPMRSYMRYLFNDKVAEAADGTRKFKGLAWLFMGVPYSNSLLYDDEHVEYKTKYPEQFRYDYAISREQKNSAGQKNVHPNQDGRIHRRVVEPHARRKNTRVHVWSKRHGARDGRMLLRHCIQKQSCVERLRKGNEKGWSIPC